MAIAELASNLIDKLKTVPAMGNRIGLAAAGGMTDPSMKTVPLPAAWVLFESDSVTYESSRTGDVDYVFSVAVMVNYESQADLINTQLPTLEALARSVSGRESTDFAMNWQYQGAQLVDAFTDRLVYELKFMVSASYIV
jgi:hypothetical protein